MRHMKTFILICTVATILLTPGCKNATTNSDTTTKSALDWPGTYTGILPCADCDGIKTTLTIYENLTYTLQTSYLGKDDQLTTRNGTYTWNSALTTITLAGITHSPSQFLVDQNGLLQLDANGQKITGDLPDRYRLVKTTESTLGFYRWKLTQLMGAHLQNSGIAGLKFNLDDGHLNAYGWCNTFTGEFALPGDHKLRIGQLSSAVRSCPDSTAEIQFLNMLRVVDTYHVNIKGRELSLSIGNASPMAVLQGATTR